MLSILVHLLLGCTSTEASGRVRRVVGGRKAHAHKFPWQVYLEVVDNSGEELRCGGSVLSPRHIITAAHCLVDKCGRPAKRVWAHLGAHDICEEDWESSHLVRKEYMVFHPLYDPVTEDNDVALLRLKRSILMGPRVQAIALPGLEATWDCPREEREEGKAFRRARRECRREQLEDGEVDRADDYYGSEEGNYIEQEKQDLQDEYLESESEDSLESDLLDYEYHDNCSTYYDGRWATVVGWGATYKFDGSCVLRQAHKKIYANHDQLCLDSDDYVLDRDKVCAYNPKWDTDTCQGDSGSGLVVGASSGQSPVLVGVVSYGGECGEEHSPGVYARVQQFTFWLHTIMALDGW